MMQYHLQSKVLQMNIRIHNLPNGKTTRSATAYVREWRKLGNKVVKFFPDYKVVACDRGLTLFKCKKNRLNQFIIVDSLNLL